jgi:hypothetical protein
LHFNIYPRFRGQLLKKNKNKKTVANINVLHAPIMQSEPRALPKMNSTVFSPRLD